MYLAINAIRLASGGAEAHLNGILEELKSFKSSPKIDIYINSALRKKLIDVSNVNFIIPQNINDSLIKKIYWELIIFPKILKKSKYDLLLNLDAAAITKYRPMITMSRDMLSYEKG